MKKTIKFTVAAGAALALAACGSTDDAATEAEADTVEIPAEEAVANVVEEPVADPVASVPMPEAPRTPARSEQDDAVEAGANAADVAARVKAAQEAATRQAEQNMDEMETN